MELTLLLLLFLQDIVQSSAQYYCALQERTIRVTEGGSVTIPCTLSYREHVGGTAVQIYCYDDEDGYCHKVKNNYVSCTPDKYRGNISSVSNTAGHSTESIKIYNLNSMDGTVICCCGTFNYQPQPYHSHASYGTHLLFNDQFWVDQLEAVTALKGDNITIPCHINYPAGRSITVQQVTWKMGATCSRDNYIIPFQYDARINTEHFSLLDFPNEGSLHINNIQMNHGQTYCCSVITSDGEFSAKHGTELLIRGQHDSEFTINQPEESSAPIGGSANIACSYNTPINKTPLDAVIYWRAGSHDGPIAYHPSTWMVHSTYRGRTHVTRQADLQIMGVQDTDSSVYYCFVTLKFCVGNGVINNHISYGNGTRLSVTGFLCKKGHNTTAVQQIVNEPVVAGDPSNEGTREEMPYEEIKGGIVYADLKMTELEPGQSRSQPNQKTEIIYSYVK
ncbi:uncharacterized protein LOC134601517 isoform X2 [Pelobates fuscus]|uniref:uncharacterized protein LOC134601517 isoform X2 n=1 Tax=Pelobates fuscus TaxID=191477 RepID=UPI002FE4A6D4